MEATFTAGAKKLSETVKIRTVSNIDPTKTQWDQFIQLHHLLEQLFPLVHRNMEKTVVNTYSLIFHWKSTTGSKGGSSSGACKKPILFTAHMDVVPVEEGTGQDWKYGPFSGEIADGRVWGRGTLDTKIHMIAALEAAERLLAEGYAPERDVYFAFGHDEEVGGLEGAFQIAEHFKKMGVEFEFVLDEGGCVTDEIIPQVKRPLALIGVGEKGYANIRLTASGDGGHSSMPPVHSALGMVSQAICRLERRRCKTRLIKPVKEFLQKTAPYMGGVNRLILSNLWLFKPVFLAVFSRTKSGSAMLRTTTAATMAEASTAPNVLPQKASAVINFRILPGETGQDLIRHIRKVTDGIPLELEPLVLDEPSRISSTDTEGYVTIERLTKRLYPDAVVVPYIALASTDARKYEPVCRNIYRFTPYRIHNSEMGMMHGTNENISVENVDRCIEFFYLAIQGVLTRKKLDARRH